MATEAEVAAHLDLSDRRVRELKKEGLFASVQRGGYDLDACRSAYIRQLRERAAGRAGDGAGDLDLVQERARLAAAQADAQAMRNALSRAELLPRADVTKTVQAAFARVRAKLLSIPSRAAPLVSAMRTATEVQSKLTELLHEALAELAATRVVANDSADRSGGDDGDGLVAGDDAASDADRKPVGGRKSTAKPGGKRRTG